MFLDTSPVREPRRGALGDGHSPEPVENRIRSRGDTLTPKARTVGPDKVDAQGRRACPRPERAPQPPASTNLEHQPKLVKLNRVNSFFKNYRSDGWDYSCRLMMAGRNRRLRSKILDATVSKSDHQSS